MDEVALIRDTISHYAPVLIAHLAGLDPLIFSGRRYGRINGGGGYWINHGNDTDDKDFWFFGWLLQRKITDKLTLGGEIFHQTADTINGKDSTGFNIGGFYNIDEHNHILFSAGRGFQNASESNLNSWYIAYQITN